MKINKKSILQDYYLFSFRNTSSSGTAFNLFNLLGKILVLQELFLICLILQEHQTFKTIIYLALKY